MSWDVLLTRLPEHVRSIGEIPKDYRPQALGPRSEVGEALAIAVPSVDMTDPAWGMLEGPGWSIELNIGHADPVDAIMLHIRGSGDDVLTHVFRMAAELTCHVVDCSDGELITEGATGQWHAWQEFRNRVIADPVG